MVGRFSWIFLKSWCVLTFYSFYHRMNRYNWVNFCFGISNLRTVSQFNSSHCLCIFSFVIQAIYNSIQSFKYQNDKKVKTLSLSPRRRIRQRLPIPNHCHLRRNSSTQSLTQKSTDVSALANNPIFINNTLIFDLPSSHTLTGQIIVTSRFIKVRRQYDQWFWKWKQWKENPWWVQFGSDAPRTAANRNLQSSNQTAIEVLQIKRRKLNDSR